MRQFPHLGLCNFPAWYSRQHLSKLLHRQYVANPETVAAAPVSGTTASTTPSEWFLCPSSCQQARQRRYGFHVTNLLVIVDQTIGDGKCHVAVTVCGQPDEKKKKDCIYFCGVMRTWGMIFIRLKGGPLGTALNIRGRKLVLR